MPVDDVTPIRQQYLEIKRQYPNAILFFRLGDFYETFDQDAETTSRELDIVLTSRSVAKGVRVPMAGIPYHAVENYLARLIEKGYHGAICEQVGDQPARGLFPRQVTRVVTPGTIIEPGLLQSDRNNYLVSLVFQEDGAGISYVDISTGEFSATQFSGENITAQVRSEIMRLNPAEILIPENKQTCRMALPGNLTCWASRRFEPGRCEETLRRHFQTSSLDGFGLRGQTLAIRAGAILQYLQETQPAAFNLLAGSHKLQHQRIYEPGCCHPPQPGNHRNHSRGRVARLSVRYTGSYSNTNGQTADPPVGQQTAVGL